MTVDIGLNKKQYHNPPAPDTGQMPWLRQDKAKMCTSLAIVNTGYPGSGGRLRKERPYILSKPLTAMREACP